MLEDYTCWNFKFKKCCSVLLLQKLKKIKSNLKKIYKFKKINT